MKVDPRPTVDEIELSVARAGAATPLVSATFTAGQTLALDGVPIEDDLVVHMVGRAVGAEIAYGRTCRFAIGSPAQVVDALLAQYRAGVTHLTMRLSWPGMPQDDVLAGIELLGRAVLPEVRRRVGAGG